MTTTQNPTTKTYDPIDVYKLDYYLFVRFKGSRYKVIQSLEKYIEKFEPILLKVNKSKFQKTYLYDFEELSEKVQSFLKTKFPESVYNRFKGLPERELQNITPNRNLNIALNLLNTFSSQEYVNKIIAQENFLVYIKNCLENYGLHKDIDTRIPLIYGRYLVSITHNHKRKTNKREVSHVLKESEMREEFLTPYLDRVDISIGGNKLSYDTISNFRIARLVLLDDEIPLFKAKHRLASDDNKGLFDKSKDVTHQFVTTSKVNHNFVIGKEIWDTIHPKLRPLIKPHIKSRQYDKAILTAFIEFNSIIKEAYKSKTGDEEDGVSLMQKAFSPKNPIFKLTSDLETTSGKNEQLGFMQLSSGAMTAFRNPLGHENRTISLKDAVSKISIASYLLETFEKWQ